MSVPHPFRLRSPVYKAARLDPGWTRELLALSLRTEQDIAARLLTAFDAASQAISTQRLEAALTARDAKAATAAAHPDLVSTGTAALQAEEAKAAVAAANLELGRIPVGTKGAFVFNPQAPKLKAWLTKQAGARIVEIDDETKQAVVAVIKRALEEGVHPYDAARTIKQSVGLTQRMANATFNLDQRLAEQGVTDTLRAKQVARYAERMRNLRAEMIARTETMSALNQGRHQLRLQLVEDGVLPKDQRVRWRTGQDERVCDICGPADGEEVELGEEFSTGVETAPAHPSCRCITTLVDMSEDEEESVETSAESEPRLTIVLKYAPDQPRDDHGRFGEGQGDETLTTPALPAAPTGGGESPKTERGARAAAAYRPAEKDKQDFATASEQDIARRANGQVTKDNEPVDVIMTDAKGRTVGIELKTLCDAGNDKITMKAEAQARKKGWERKHGRVFTLVVDRRDEYAGGAHREKFSGQRAYVKRGWGSLRLSGMQGFASEDEALNYIRAAR